MPSVTVVAVVNNPIFDAEEELPDTALSAVSEAVLGNTDISTNIIKRSILSFSGDVKGYLAYGKSKYYRGIPSGNTTTANIDTDAVEAIYSAIVGEPVTMLSIRYGFLDRHIAVGVHMQNDYGWEVKTNSYTALNNFGALKTFTVDSIVYRDYGDPNRNNYADIYKQEQVGINDDDVSPLRHRYYLPLQSDTYYLGSYYLNSKTPEDAVYFYYDTLTNVYPQLTTPVRLDAASEYYPIAVLRENFVDANSAPSSEKYITTNKLLKYLNLNLDDLIDGSISANPDSGKMRDAFVTLSLNMNTERPDSILYLYHYFKRQSFASVYTKADYLIYKRNNTGNPLYFNAGVAEIRNEISISESNYNKKIRFNYIVVETKSGIIADKGMATSTFEDAADLIIELYYDSDTSESVTISVKQHLHIFRYQETANTYVEVEVSGLETITTIAGRLPTEEDNTQYLIPVNHQDLDILSPFERERVLYDSLNLVVYAYERIKLKWYQTKIFRAFITIVSVVIAVLTGIQLIQLFQFSVVLGLIVLFSSFAILFLAKKIGGAVGALFAVVAFFYLPVKFGGIGGNYGALVTGETLAKLSMATLDVFTNDIALEFERISSKAAFLEDEFEERFNQLQETDDFLSHDGGLTNPLLTFSIGPYINPDESADNFYTRTLSTNQVSITLEALDVYYDNELRLPEPNDVLIGTPDNSELDGNLDWFQIS